ncbi:MAG: ATP-dependent DNA helicase [bacterium]|nr:ATP-dependent DNA helicase [bacterium]
MSFVPSPEQKEVIEHGLEPLRVTAGAGTGKTSTLAYRMVRLADRFGIRPDEVLGVTFTNKAAEELAHRIGRARDHPPRPGEGVTILTYHGFAMRLLATYGTLVGMERDTRVVAPVLSRQILRECLVETPFEAVDASNTDRVVDNLLKLSGELADNLLRPHALLQEPPGGEVQARRIELARALVRYEQAKVRLGVRDYGDLIRLAVELVREHGFVARRVRESFRCVLLDEYQDTNPAQQELFALLFGQGMAVTAVGDLDQTVYEWRGASPNNFGFFPDRFRQKSGSEALTLRLTVNRRSGKRILDLSNRIRTRISVVDRAADQTALDGTPPGEVHAAWYGNARREAEEVARQIRRLHEAGLAWSDIAVLFRKNRDIELVRLALEEHAVPYQVSDLGGLLRVPEIVELHAWLRLLADPEDGPALVRILLGSRYRLGLSDLAPLSRRVAEQSHRAETQVVTHTLVEAIENLEAIELTGGAKASLAGFRDLYRVLLTESQGTGLSGLARLILSRTGAWHEIDAMPWPSNVSARLNIHRFLDFAEHWNPLEGRASLEAFLHHLELMRDDPVEELDAARVGSDDAVALTTVHRAKGLEWRAVFLPALYRGNFPSSPRQLLDPARCEFALPAHMRIDREFRTHLDPSVDGNARRAWLRERHHDQEWRLAYVACTRAEEYLYLSGAHWYGIPQPLKKPSRPSEFLELALQMDGVAVDEWIAEAPSRPETLRFPIPQPGPDPVFGVAWEEALHLVAADPDWTARRAERLGIRELYDGAVEEFQQTLLDLPEPAKAAPGPGVSTVSVTGLVTYASCPKRYYWTEVDRLPRRPGPGALRGTRLHRRIELHNRGMIPFDELDDDLYDRSPDEEAVPRATSASGWSSFLGSPYATRTPIYVEAPFEFSLDPDIRIRGRVDAVYPLRDDGWEIVDFKSGRRPGRAPDDVQLRAYAVAAQDGGLGATAPHSLRVSFVYLGDGLEVHGQEVNETWLQQARNRIIGLMENIRAERFRPEPSPACRTCDFRHVCPEGRDWLEAGS